MAAVTCGKRVKGGVSWIEREQSVTCSLALESIEACKLKLQATRETAAGPLVAGVSEYLCLSLFLSFSLSSRESLACPVQLTLGQKQVVLLHSETQWTRFTCCLLYW